MRVVLMVNDKDSCNLKCNHCFLSYTGKRTPEDTLKLVKDLRNQGCEVRLSGSELLTDLDYLKCIKSSGRDYVMTNGLILSKDKSVYEELSQNNIKEIRMSRHYGISSELDSAPLDLSSEVCVEAKQRGFRVGFMIVITDKNYQMIGGMCKDASSLNANSLGFLNYVGSKRLDAEKRKDFFDNVQEQRAKFDKSELEIAIHGDFGPRPGKGETLAKQNNYCPAVKDQIVITPDNTVYGCPFLMDSPIGKFENGVIKIEKDLFEGRRDCCLVDLL